MTNHRMQGSVLNWHWHFHSHSISWSKSQSPLQYHWVGEMIPTTLLVVLQSHMAKVIDINSDTERAWRISKLIQSLTQLLTMSYLHYKSTCLSFLLFPSAENHRTLSSLIKRRATHTTLYPSLGQHFMTMLPFFFLHKLPLLFLSLTKLPLLLFSLFSALPDERAHLLANFDIISVIGYLTLKPCVCCN